MLDRTRTTFSLVKPADTPWQGDGLRDFFLYRDLGVAAATNGQVIAQRVNDELLTQLGLREQPRDLVGQPLDHR